MVTHIRELRQFESIYILQEKPDTHNTYVLMTSCTRQPFVYVLTELSRATASEKEGSRHNPQPVS
jgi:hypothetical protein